MFNLHRLSWITVHQSHQLSTVRVMSWNYVFAGQQAPDITSKLSSQHSERVSCLTVCITEILTVNGMERRSL